MTEAEWLTCNDPRPMLDLLRGKARVRKLRLFVCACLRAVGDCLDDAASRRAVLALERFADGSVSRAQFQAITLVGWKKGWEELRANTVAVALGRRADVLSVWWLTQTAAALWARYGAPPGKRGERLRRERSAEAKAAQAAYWRALFGNPFRPVPVIDPSWLAWKGGTLPKLARAIYDGGDFTDLPVLADALEEDGCTDADML